MQDQDYHDKWWALGLFQTTNGDGDGVHPRAHSVPQKDDEPPELKTGCAALMGAITMTTVVLAVILH